MSTVLKELLKLESGWDCKDVISRLNDKQKSKLLEEVVPVCQQWTSMRVMPNGDIGLLARYQELKFLVEDSLTTNRR